MDTEPLIQVGHMIFFGRYEQKVDTDALAMMRTAGRNPACAAAFFDRNDEEYVNGGFGCRHIHHQSRHCICETVG